jgi:hypothetical protein
MSLHHHAMLGSAPLGRHDGSLRTLCERYASARPPGDASRQPLDRSFRHFRGKESPDMNQALGGFNGLVFAQPG